MRKILLTLLFAGAVLNAAAQRPRTRVEWGVVGGINIPDYSTNMDATDVKNKLGWQAGIVTAINLGAFAVEPQILYVRQGLRIRPEGEGEINLKSNSIDVPVLASLRLLHPVRIYAGPVFTVMNDCKQKSGGDLLDFGRVRPTVSFTVGAGVVLMRHLLSKTTDKKQRAYLINHFLDQFKGTVYRQTMFAEFELAMGKMAENGEALTADALCRKYHELNKLYFGPDMISDDQIALEWARIPHFFYNYYVFQYATGFSAAVAIANRILKEGAPAVADYKKFLSGGCSTDPISLLKIAGVDMSSPEPVNSALALFGELVDELAELL